MRKSRARSGGRHLFDPGLPRPPDQDRISPGGDAVSPWSAPANSADAGGVAAVEAHLAVCAECRDEVAWIRSLRSQADDLPRSIEPPRDLFPEIRERIAANPPVASSGEEAVGAIESAWTPTLRELEQALLEGREELQPETLEVIEANLRIIDQAIHEAREALAADPASQGAARSLTLAEWG